MQVIEPQLPFVQTFPEEACWQDTTNATMIRDRHRSRFDLGQWSKR